MGLSLRACLLLSAAAAALPNAASAQAPQLLFRLSADKSLIADRAGGDPVPNFRTRYGSCRTGRCGARSSGTTTASSPGRRPAISTPSAARSPSSGARAPRSARRRSCIFRVGFADHTSWDMAWLRIDWNGHGFDAFVTDANLARTRVSFNMPASCRRPTNGTHLAFAWDETVGVRLFVDGKRGRAQATARPISTPGSTSSASPAASSRRTRCRAATTSCAAATSTRSASTTACSTPAAVAALARKRGAQQAAGPDAAAAEPRRRGCTATAGTAPARRLLTAPVTRIRKVEFADAKDLKEWMWKGVDGIAETTWPGVYNRSRLPGRDDYFELPDWNIYVEGGKAYDLTVPAGRDGNRVEIRGAAYGDLSWSADGGRPASSRERPKDVVRSVDPSRRARGGALRFTNVAAGNADPGNLGL